jgi:hypothetical protein
MQALVTREGWPADMIAEQAVAYPDALIEALPEKWYSYLYLDPLFRFDVGGPKPWFVFYGVKPSCQLPYLFRCFLAA